MQDLSLNGLKLNELKQIAKMRRIKGYKSMSKEKLLSAIRESESAKSLDNAKIKKIREDFNELRDRFLKPKIKEIRKNLYEIENKKNLSVPELKEIEKFLAGLEESLSKLKNYHDHDDAEYKGIRDIENLFIQSIDKNYYKPTKTKYAFNGSYIEYESRGDKDRNLSQEEQLNTIKPYLKDIKYFIGYIHKGSAFPSPLCVKPPQMNAYAKYFDKNNKYIYLLVNDKEILKKHSKI